MYLLTWLVIAAEKGGVRKKQLRSDSGQSATVKSGLVGCREFANTWCCNLNYLHSPAASAPFTSAEAKFNKAEAGQSCQVVLCCIKAAKVWGGLGGRGCLEARWSVD